MTATQTLKNTLINKIFWIAYTSTSIVCFIRSYMGFNDWLYTHWAFNYENGFIKRGLIGSILKIINPINKIQFITIISILLIIFLWVFFTILIKKLIELEPNKYRISILILSLFIISSPATLQHYAYDIGRFDLFGLLLLIISIGVINKISKPSILIPFIILISIISILIHEAAFFMYIPFIIGYYIYKSDTASYKTVAILSITALFSAYLISTIGSKNSSNFHNDYINAMTYWGDWLSSDSYGVIYNAELSHNIQLTLNHGFSKEKIIDHLKVIIITLTPMAFIIFPFIKNGDAKILNKKSIILLTSSLGSFGLYFIGVDHFRWISSSFTILTISIILILINEKNIRNSIFKHIDTNKNILLLFIPINIITGGLGDKYGLPLINITISAGRFFW